MTPASWLVIQWRTSNVIIFFTPPSLNSKLALRSLGVSWSSSNMKWPPMALTLVGYFTPRPQRAMSTWWMPWLPMSPLP